MKEQSPQLSSDELNSLFAQLNPLDVEQFYTAYQLWNVRQRIQTLQALTDAIQRDIAENAECLEQVHPSAIALASLARLQANGVSDISLLDCMLDRGEEWLDRAIQHLEYCEKLDLISDGYTKWCEHALEGAYDWIDSMPGQEAADPSTIEPPFSESAAGPSNSSPGQEETRENSEPGSELMEELFLQKLMSDDLENAEEAENDASMLETTLKIRAFSPTTQQEPLPDTVSTNNADNTGNTENPQLTQAESSVLPTVQETRPEEVEPTPVLEETQAEHTEVTMMAVEEQDEQQPALQHLEVVREEIDQSTNAVDAQEQALINKLHMETVAEQETDIAEAGTIPELEVVPELADRPDKEDASEIRDMLETENVAQNENVPISEQVAQSGEVPVSEHVQEPGYPREQEPGYPQGDTPTIDASVDANGNTIVPATSTKAKPKRGVLRTLVAILFHI